MDTIIVIPIYTTSLNEAEYISLQQVFRIFPLEAVCYIIPENLDLNVNNRLPAARYEVFSDSYFKDVYGYSQLLTTSAFYQRFVHYKYMLIIQLDAFVFGDRIKEFCEYDFDYYGARIPKIIWPYLKHRVGNGGFSLRKISSCIEMCNRKNEILSHARKILSDEDYDEVAKVEDQFFAFCGNEFANDFKLAPNDIAGQFSIEFNVDDIYNTLEYSLPFGCHRWYQGHLEMWWLYIKRYGYSLSEQFWKEWEDCISPYDYKMFFENQLSENNKYEYHLLLDELVGIKQLVIWGDGARGKKMKRILNDIEYGDYKVVDIKIDRKCSYRGEKYISVDEVDYDESFIVITPVKDNIAIQKKLESLGLNKKKDFITFSGLIKEFLSGS